MLNLGTSNLPAHAEAERGRLHLTVNHVTCRHTGYSEAELVGQPAASLFEEEEEEEASDAASCLDALPLRHPILRRLVREGFVRNIEKTLRRKDGGCIPVLFSGSVMRDNQKQVSGIVCLALDISDRKQAEKELRESEQRFMEVLNRSEDAILLIVEIEDTGTGIPERVRGRIFEPFFTTKEVGKGSGQGLAIANSVVTKKHGGALTFRTQEGQGTTFIIRIPVDGKNGKGG
jgi:PAS domain S-box-containing protein